MRIHQLHYTEQKIANEAKELLRTLGVEAKNAGIYDAPPNWTLQFLTDEQLDEGTQTFILNKLHPTSFNFNLITRDEIIREATYHAAVAGYYDTSEEAQESGALTISIMDMADLEALPAGATHRFYVMINATAYMVTRFADRYEVEPHDHVEIQKQEREMRLSALDYALWYLTGEGMGYRPGQGNEARTKTIQELLDEGKEFEEGPRPSELTYPVLRDIEPDIFLAPGDEYSVPILVSREWRVTIGPFNACKVGLVGTDEDEQLEFVAVDDDPIGFDEELSPEEAEREAAEDEQRHHDAE